MGAGLPLRLRVFLFFALLGLGGAAVVAGSLVFAARRAAPTDPIGALLTGGILAGFLIVALVVAIWWLFDANVAKPIDRISADLRARAHADVAQEIDTTPTRYLGDLGPAAEAVAKNLTTVRHALDETVAQQTARLKEQTAQLRTLLSDVNAGLLLCSPSHQLVFYNAPSVELLKDTGRPRLDRSVFDLLREAPIRRTYAWLRSGSAPDQGADLLVSTTGCGRTIAAHMRLVSGALGLGETPGYVLTLRDVSADMRLHTERERLMTEMVDALRAPAATLRALLDIRADGETGFDAAIAEEADTLVSEIEAIARRQDANRDTWWPMHDVRASHLFDALRGLLGADAPPIDAPSPRMWLRCDGDALVTLLAALVETALERGLAQAFSLSVTEEPPGAVIRLSWAGPPMAVADINAVLDAPVRDAAMAVTGREILNHHNTDIWPESADDGTASVVLPIAEATASDPAPKPSDWVAERPTVYDFKLLDQVRDGSKAGKRLGDLTYVVFDTETTGLDPKGGDEIVQIAAVRIVNGRIVRGESIDQLVDPGRSIPPASTKIHGISQGMVQGAPDIAAAGAQFHRFCENAVLVAHNAPFDLAFLHRHSDTIGARFDHPVFDTVLLSAILFGQAESHTLDSLADRLGVVIPEAARHTAMGDALATAQVFRKMIPMLEARGFATFDAVMDGMRQNSRMLREMKARVG